MSVVNGISPKINNNNNIVDNDFSGNREIDAEAHMIFQQCRQKAEEEQNRRDQQRESRTIDFQSRLLPELKNKWRTEGKKEDAIEEMARRAQVTFFENLNRPNKVLPSVSAGAGEIAGFVIKMATDPVFRETAIGQVGQNIFTEVVNRMFQKEGILNILSCVLFGKPFQDTGLVPECKHQLNDFVDFIVQKMYGEKAPEVAENGLVNHALNDFHQAFDRFEKLFGPLNTLLNGINGKLGFNHAPALNGEARSAAEQLEDSGLPGSMPFSEMVPQAKSMLSSIISGAGQGLVDQAMPMVLTHLLKGLRWGVHHIQKNTQAEDQYHFTSLIASIDSLINSNQVSAERASDLLQALEDFSRNIKENNIQFLVDGFVIPLCIMAPGADFTATPNYDRAIANRKLMNLDLAPVKGHKTDLSQFKQDFSQYMGLRFAYETLAGLFPEDNFYRDIFKQGRDLKILKRKLFAALEQAHRNGNLSKARLWMTKLLFFFVQPICKQFVEPFLDNVETKLRPMLGKRVIKTTVKDLVDEFTNYLGNMVTKFQEVAKGDYPKEAGALDAILSEKVEKAAYPKARKVIQEAIREFAPEFTFASRAINKLKNLRIDAASSLKILNPLLTCLKVFPLVLLFISLYVPQVVINAGMKWGIKRIMMTKSKVLDSVVKDVATATDKDFFIQRARLQTMQSFLLSMIGNMKDSQPIQEDEQGSHSEEKSFDSMVSHLLLATKYGNAMNVEELQKIVKAGKTDPKNIFSFFESKFKGLLHEQTQKRTVEQLTKAYREMFNDSFVAEQVEGFLEMLSQMFDPILETEEEIKQEIAALESTNTALLEELMNYAIGKGIEEQFDTTGKAQAERLEGVVSSIKTKTEAFIADSRAKILDLKPEGLNSATLIFSSYIAQYFKNNPQLTKDAHMFDALYLKYAQSLGDWQNDTASEEKKAAVLADLEQFDTWKNAIKTQQNINISIFANEVKKGMGLIKDQVRSFAEHEVRKIEKFLLKPYNVAGMTHMVLGMFGDKKFFFQKHN